MWTHFRSRCQPKQISNSRFDLYKLNRQYNAFIPLKTLTGYFQLITKVALHQSATIQAEALKILTGTGNISGYLSGDLNITLSGGITHSG